MLVIIIALAACVAALIASNFEFKRMFAFNAILLLGSTVFLFGFGIFNIYNFSLMIGECFWLHYIYNHKFDRRDGDYLSYLGNAFFKAAIPCISTWITLLILSNVFFREYIANFPELLNFFLLRS